MDMSVTPESEKSEIEIPDEFKAFLLDPPLLQGEDAKAYQSLLRALVQDRQPKTLDEWFEIQDYITSFWEEMRLRQASVGLMRGEMFSALMHFLIQIGADGKLANLTKPKMQAFAYFSDDPKKRKAMIDLLATYGISPAGLQAKAAQLNRDAIQMFERMTNTRVKRRLKLRKKKTQ